MPPARFVALLITGILGAAAGEAIFFRIIRRFIRRNGG